ncbi:UDP:flavonoid glycosyltransferase YjiC, YdhE family [Noviherbaspirillum humi]|uniref:UDP:flavonoid glycosyltransferase YjiC, YdhE family n=1 Tax=Noviherbaspirillum humi TaxID=1688639 RepID=A0A239E9F8_9BURK|nr:glycosyltransferase [Noviherbaspirillum humi]SNS40918.1 UDP:flavonoid glycosyltransferase YjiC, YdhE family [Noviherbaspirillum humi]
MKQPHVVFATAGSLGDLYPFLALGMELRRRGHRVSVATSTDHRTRVEAAGLEFRPMRPDPPGTPEFFARYMHPKTGAEFVYRSYLSPAIRDSHADLLAVVRDADLLVSQSLMAMAAPLVAADTGIPWISAVFQPMTLFSLHDRPSYLPVPLLADLCARYPEVHARVVHYVKKHTRQWVQPIIEFRQELGLDPAPHPMYEGQHSPRRVLAMFSPLLGGSRPDWPTAAMQTGTATYAGGGEPMAEPLRRFLAATDQPLAIFTLSSAPGLPGDFYRHALSASADAGMRALLVTSGLSASAPLPDPLPDGAMRVDYVPFEEVLPHAAVLVHAGGIGTMFKAMQAGIPQVVMPQAHDQADNALRLARHGAARIIPPGRFGRRSLVRALRAAISGTAMRDAAEALAARARREDGVARACDEIERQLEASPRAAAY